MWQSWQYVKMFASTQRASTGVNILSYVTRLYTVPCEVKLNMWRREDGKL